MWKCVCKRSIYERALWKETSMWVVNEQDFQFSRSHWVMVYQNKKKTYFPDSFGRDFTHYDFKFKRPVYQVSRRLQSVDSKLCNACLVFFGSRLASGLDLNSIMDYFTWDCRLTDEFIRSSRPELFLVKGVLKICSSYRGTPMAKCDFKKVALHTSSWVFSCKFAAYFQNTFEHFWVAASSLSTITSRKNYRYWEQYEKIQKCRAIYQKR